MVVKYIGKTTDFCGKPLWEILGNLKNFGVGRLVKRNMFERYPEPCFFRVVKVETVNLPSDPLETRKVIAWVEKVFRGYRYPKLIELYSASYKSDYRLVPKSEEQALWDRVNNMQACPKMVPTKIPFPPLLRLMEEDDARKKGLPTGDLHLKLVLNKGSLVGFKQLENQ